MIHDTDFFREYIRCCELTIFKGIRENKLFACFEKIILLLSEKEIQSISEIISAWGEYICAFVSQSPELHWKSALEKIIINDENPFTLKIESVKQECTDIKDLSLYIPLSLISLAEKDLDNLRQLVPITPHLIAEKIKKECISLNIQFESGIPEINSFSQTPFPSQNLFELWKLGAGIMGKSHSFVWQKYSLLPVSTPDSITIDQLIGYGMQRALVLENTRRFAAGFRANNLLLYGDRGTGKSATIKAVAKAVSLDRVKIIEVRKQDLKDFPKIIELLRDRNFRFIIFIDDLSFDRADESYVGLKALLEGGLETRPSNVLLYATSNRRHLIKERIQDRLGLSSIDSETEIRAQDSLQEQLSLADRFGMTIIFSSPLQDEYLAIVEGMIEKRGLKVDMEKALADALRWEKWYNGRSPRTARQFVDWLEGGEEAPWDRIV